MWVPVAGLPPRLALSAFSGAGRFCILSSGAARWKDVPARNRRGLSDFQPQLLPSESFRDLPAWVSKGRFESRRYIISPRLAETVVQFLLKQDDCKMVLEFNPGPGILTQALLQRGATVIAVESDKTFIPHLESLGKKLGGKLHVLHCDFFKLDPRSYGKIMANPQNPNLYHALSVLWQVACEIKLLHVEPCSSFDIHTQSGQLEKPEWRESSEQQRQQNLCFIQLTPRRNLFTKNLTPVNYDVFFHMLKQCFMKRNAKLIDHLNSLSPIDAMDILKKIKQKKTTKITKMYPEDFKHLFETIECSQNYTCKWLYDDFMEEVVI
ncbi:dimethyladenosine transferase 2, mitochondrial isoform X2 [Molossus molossus]|uniref:dimethyladenosine transferase 2, mitochondrial isoform X2 n=1 Tax=Molossus molossus TaxID=27622 RepID=UPI001747C5B3|nr:dimethyladenosine transferase 2, mitochondrial isoform X2 [Molossus molossus]